MESLIEVKDLKTNFYTDAGVVRAVNGVDFTIEREKTLGVVGESGCGKSVTALSIMRLILHPGKIVGGEILFHRNGTAVDLTKLDWTRAVPPYVIGSLAAFWTIQRLASF